MGRRSVLVFDCTSTCRTKPLESGKTCVIRPMSQEFLGAFSSTIRTMSPVAKFLLFLFHFCLIWSSGRYSLVHRFQNKLAMYWIWRHLLFPWQSLGLKTPGGRNGFDLSSKRWFGVRGSKSPGSLETVVMGRSFMIASTSQKSVASPSSSSFCSCVRALRMRLTVLICLSQIPPWWEPAGGLNIQFISSLRSLFWICVWFNSCIASFSSRSALTKLVPLSDLMTLTGPLLAMNLLMALMQESELRLCASSRWTALMFRQVKITPYLLTVALLCFNSNGPKKSTRADHQG